MDPVTTPSGPSENRRIFGDDSISRTTYEATQADGTVTGDRVCQITTTQGHAMYHVSVSEAAEKTVVLN